MYLGLTLAAAMSVMAGACGQTATVNINSAANQNSMNRNAMMANGDMMNHDGMTNANHDMSGMTGNMKSDPNASSQPYDLQFIDTMSAHHQGAVEMAQMVITKSGNGELKQFAQKIISDQKKEIATMKEWRDKWFAGMPAAKNMEMSGMMDSMKMMSGDEMKKMETASGKDFDLMFLDMMTPHHAGAITMAKEALAKAEHPEIKTLSNNIIKAQEAEIKQMADWKSKWSK